MKLVMLILVILFSGFVVGAYSKEFKFDVDDTTTQKTVFDTIYTNEKDSIPQAAAPRKLKIVKRHFKYKEQIGLAVGMMAFILVVMTTAQAWNPD